MIPDPRERPWLNVEEAGALLGLGRSKSYIEVHRYLATGGTEGLPVIAFGRTLRVPTAKVVRLLGLDRADDDRGDDFATVVTLTRGEGPAPTAEPSPTTTSDTTARASSA